MTSSTSPWWGRIAPPAIPTFLLAIAVLLGASTARADTYTVTSTQCEGAGSITEAMTLANSNPGEDTITFSQGLVVDFAGCPPGLGTVEGKDYYALRAEESVIFDGNGATLQGAQVWIDDTGDNVAKTLCNTEVNALVLASTPGFIAVGADAQDNSAITVTVRDLDMSTLSGVARINQNATLVMEDLTASRIFAGPDQLCTRPIIEAVSGANFAAHRTNWFDIRHDGRALFGTVFSGMIGGGPLAGDLTIEDSSFVDAPRIDRSGVIAWTGAAGSEVNIVSSRFQEVGGIMVSGDASGKIVNSIWSSAPFGDPNLDDRIVNFSSQELDIVASTLLFASDTCNPDCQNETLTNKGWVYRENGGARTNFKQSAVAVNNPNSVGPVYAKLLDPGLDPGQGFSADEDTWIMETALQDADALKAVTGQPLLLTAPPGLPAISILPARAAPIVPGLLIDQIADSDCGGTNELMNPIDGSCITKDALGNPRVDGNGSRNIGAVQLQEAPHLSVVAVGGGTVDLGWTKPKDLTGSFTGYVLFYRESGSTGAFTEVPINGPDTLTYQVTGLTNGTEYEFLIDSFVDGALGNFTSNVVTATPMGTLGVAQPTTVNAGDGSLQVFWAAPTTLGGYKGLLSYSVLFRPVGTQTWLLGPQSLTAQTTLLPGLTNGTTYEIGILAQTDDGGLSPTLGTDPGDGIGRGTPQAAPTLSYAAPGPWPQNTPLTLTPTVTQLQGSGTYSIDSGALPNGMMLNTSTGVIFGTPTTQQSTSAVIRLTDGSTGLLTEATVALTIVATTPDPQLWYPSVQTSVGIGPVSATPTQANIPAGATFSVVSGESLPAGFSIDATTGVVSGTPTSAPGRVVAVDIQACWDGCDPSAGEVRVAPMLFYILPGLQYPANTDATAGVAVTITPTVDLWSGGVFSITAGSLPAGMSLNLTTGVISGTPQTALNAQLTIRYSTGVNVSGLEYVTSTTQINVSSPQITLTYPAATGTVGKDLTVTPTVTGVSGTALYTLVSGPLPQGLNLNPATGVITGVPSGPPGSYQVVIQVTDPYGSQRTGVVIELQAVQPPTPIPTVSPPVLALLAILMTLMVGLARRRRRVRR